MIPTEPKKESASVETPEEIVYLPVREFKGYMIYVGIPAIKMNHYRSEGVKVSEICMEVNYQLRNLSL